MLFMSLCDCRENFAIIFFSWLNCYRVRSIVNFIRCSCGWNIHTEKKLKNQSFLIKSLWKLQLLYKLPAPTRFILRCGEFTSYRATIKHLIQKPKILLKNHRKKSKSSRLDRSDYWSRTWKPTWLFLRCSKRFHRNSSSTNQRHRRHI